MIFWSLMVGAGESYVVAFALANGYSERYAGVLAIVPLGVASLLQIFFVQLLPLFKTRRYFVMTCAALQSACLLLIISTQGPGQGGELSLILLMTFYWMFGLAAGPVWNAWIVSLVPASIRPRFFSRRGIVHEIALMLGLCGAGMFLHLNHGSLRSYAIIFAFAGLARLCSSLTFSFHPNESKPIHSENALNSTEFFKWIKQKKIFWIILFMGLFQFGVSVGAPYFTPFLLKKMKLSYELYMLVLAVPLLTRAISYPFHQKWMNRFGVKKVLLSCTMMIAVIPFFWTRIQGIEMFLVLQVLAGGAWAGFEYCMLIRQINDFSHSERSRVLTWTNLFVGLFTILGVCVGSMIIGPYPKFSDYTNVFTMSAVMRFFPLLLVFVMDWGAVKVSVTRIYFRMMGVRANRGSVARPILYTDEEEEKKQSTHR